MTLEYSDNKKTYNESCIGLIQSDYCMRSVFCLRCWSCTFCESCEECRDCHFCINCFGLKNAVLRYKNKTITPDEFFELSGYVVDDEVIRDILSGYKDNASSTKVVILSSRDWEYRPETILRYLQNNPDRLIYIKRPNDYMRLERHEGQRGKILSIRDIGRKPFVDFPYVLRNNTQNVSLAYITKHTQVEKEF